MQLVEEETRRYRPSKNYLEFLQPPKSTFEVNFPKFIQIIMCLSVSVIPHPHGIYAAVGEFMFRLGVGEWEFDTMKGNNISHMLCGNDLATLCNFGP